MGSAQTQKEEIGHTALRPAVPKETPGENIQAHRAENATRRKRKCNASRGKMQHVAKKDATRRKKGCNASEGNTLHDVPAKLTRQTAPHTPEHTHNPQQKTTQTI